ncbi:MAG TPA: amidohydrolase family protein [Gemmatimonadales bacterium]
MGSSRHALEILVLSLVLCTCGGSDEETTAYVGAGLWDGTGSPMLLDAVVVVTNGVITAVGPPDLVEVPRGAREVRLDGRWIIPGLIDAHTHAERWTLPLYLSYGVTSIRDLGGDQDSLVQLRDDVESGAADGPRMYISGAAIDGAPASLREETAVASASEGRRAVGNRVLIDATQISVSTKITRGVLAAILQEASALQTPVAARLGRIDAVTAATAGVASIELLSGVAEATLRSPQPVFAAYDDSRRGRIATMRAWDQLDSAALQRTAQQLVEAGVSIVPGLLANETFAHLDDASYLAALDLSGVPPPIRAAWTSESLVRDARAAGADFGSFRRARSKQDLFVRRFRAEGGWVAAGSGSPRPPLAPGASLHGELALLVAAGLSPKDALLAATRNAARMMGTDSIGVLRPGAVADFVVLTADPFADIMNVAQVMFVVSRGVHYDPANLRSTP